MSGYADHGERHAHFGSDPTGAGVYEIKIFADNETVEATSGEDSFHFEIGDDLAGRRLVKVGGYVSTAPSSIVEVMVTNATTSTDMLTDVITIDSATTSSLDATDQPVISAGDAKVALKDQIRIDVQAGDDDAKGLGVKLWFA